MQSINNPKPRQICNHLLMIRPRHFGYNAETADSNAFMKADESLTREAIHEKAQAEFDQFVQGLRDVGIQVTVFEDQASPITTDAVFPNNWISFHEDKKVFLYPMMAPSRRKERRTDIVEFFQKQAGPLELLDWSHYEDQGQFLEGTGSMVLDRANGKVYACLSARTHMALLERFCAEINAELIAFDAVDKDGLAIYHTNVMMAIGEGYAVVCLEAVQNADQNLHLQRSLQQTGHEIIEISYEQMYAFAGNMLQVQNQQGQAYLIMSKRAFESLSVNQRQKLIAYNLLLIGELDVIETYGGGSVRCMMAEVFI